MLKFGSDGTEHYFSGLTGSLSDNHQVVRIGGDQQSLTGSTELADAHLVQQAQPHHSADAVADSLDDWF